MIAPLETENAFAHYDTTKYMVMVCYRKTLTPAVTASVYDWMMSLGDLLMQTRGAIFDFTQVRRFDSSNISSSQRYSAELNKQYDMNHIGVALVVNNIYQEKMVRNFLKMSTQQERKTIVQSYGDAFKFIRDYNEKYDYEFEPMPDNPHAFSTDEASILYDLDKNNMMITYYGVVTPQATADVYAQMMKNVGLVGVENVRGGIFDFRHVSGFDNSNLRTVQRSSSTMNQNYDMSHIAVALVVDSVRQERMVMTAMKVTPQEQRKRIVFGYGEAQNFINEFQAKQASKQ